MAEQSSYPYLDYLQLQRKEPLQPLVPQLLHRLNAVAVLGMKQVLEPTDRRMRVIKEKYLVPKFKEFARRVVEFYDVQEDDTERLHDFIDLVKKGYYPIFISNHQGYADGVAAAKLAGKVVEQTEIEQFYELIALSMMDGRQGIGGYVSFHIFNEYLKDRYTNSLGTIRKRRDDKYGYTKEEKAANMRMVGRALLEGPVKKIGSIIFPEGTLEGGRSRKDGKPGIVGAVKIEDTDYNGNIVRMLGKNRRFAILNISIEGSYRLASPDTKLPTMEGVINLFQRNTLARVRIDDPLTDTELLHSIGEKLGTHDRSEIIEAMKNDPNLFFDEVMVRICSNLPEAHQGDYRDKVKKS